MNREDLIRMAREAGLLVIGTADGSEAVYTWPQGITDELERFAALVAAAEREKVAAWMIQRGYATGHGETTEDLLNELDWQVLANWSSAMKTGAENEREACALVCEEEICNCCWDDDAQAAAEHLAATIRARKENT